MSDTKELNPSTNIIEYLRTNNEAVVTVLFDRVLDVYKSEAERTNAIDNKAIGLFTFIAAFISAIFIFINYIYGLEAIKIPNELRSLIKWVVVVISAFLAIATYFLFESVRVRSGFRAPGEKDLFEAIQECDGHPEIGNKDSTQSAHTYKRYLVEHYWKITQSGIDQNEKKATCLFRSQVIVFTCLLGLIAILISIVVSSKDMKQDQIQQPTEVKTSAEKPSTSSASTQITSSTDRPAPLKASSDGRTTQLNEGKPPALKPSTQGRKTFDSVD